MNTSKKTMIIALASILVALTFQTMAQAQSPAKAVSADSLMPVRGFCIDAPQPSGVDSFLQFVDKELAPQKVNTLFLLIDYHYQFKSHPELTDSFALSEADVKKIVRTCRNDRIRIIPQINLLGHQSWASHIGKLLQVYPQFDETPWVKNPEKYEWPNADNLYCRSYCPLMTGLHEILFPVIDELCEAFETDAFHGGMDEVFYLGEDKCPRCAGMDKAVLFAGEVRAIHDHLAQKGRELWIWGDRLIDGKTTGLGIWEASYNNTYRAIDMIPKDVVICDWHYERADKTAVGFAMKGLRVVTCPWRRPATGVIQVNDMVRFRQESTPEMRARFLGIVETTWSHTDTFLRGYYGNLKAPPGRSAGDNGENTSWNCFRTIFARIGELSR
ncbi:MAG TPA: family 20 glycosylhydrolase [Puia sp.]|nr:family 20 glycosylhydrolase [Puia sp.]